MQRTSMLASVTCFRILPLFLYKKHTKNTTREKLTNRTAFKTNVKEDKQHLLQWFQQILLWAPCAQKVTTNSLQKYSLEELCAIKD